MIFLIAKLVEFRKDMIKIKFLTMKAIFSRINIHRKSCQIISVYRYSNPIEIEMLNLYPNYIDKVILPNFYHFVE